ncbi:hypothetical protein Hdeb2414_s0016g00489911 [Helianthus debilis subsp. tardiflorus]
MNLSLELLQVQHGKFETGEGLAFLFQKASQVCLESRLQTHSNVR